MTLGLSAKLKRVGRGAFIGISLCIAMFQVCGWLGVRINLSPSLPVGLYITSAAGRLVEFCPAEPFASLSLLRGYRDRGACADGGAPLLKPVVAVAGDEVALSPAGLAVNGGRIPNTVPMGTDTKGRQLRHGPFGRFRVAPGTVWVASAYNARSFDSRYFGPVPLSAIRGRVRPLLTF